MFKLKLLAIFVFVGVLSSLAAFRPPAPAPALARQDGDPLAAASWSAWGANQFALAGDGQSIWIGATGSVLQWDKTTFATQRYGPAYGLRHRRVLAVTVDSGGATWFGGDAGLSHRDPGGLWTHYTAANSSLPHDNVDAIAITPAADGDILWLSHGLPNGSISQWQHGAVDRHYPSRQAAVEQAYQDILQTAKPTALWAVSGDEVWVDYRVYDGAAWRTRRPPDAGNRPLALRAGYDGRVWALDESDVYRWDGSAWSTFHLDFGFGGEASALAVAQDGEVWVGGFGRNSPYSNFSAEIIRLPQEPGGEQLKQSLNVTGAPADLYTTAEGLWATGPSWLLSPSAYYQGAIHIPDAPYFPDVDHALVTSADQLFVFSLNSGVDSRTTIQQFDDLNTPALGDDTWRTVGSFYIRSATAPLSDGGFWLAGHKGMRSEDGVFPYRRFSNVWLVYRHLPIDPTYQQTIRDIYVQDDRHTWFAFDHWDDDRRGIILLDDGGTPAHYDDDVWTQILTPWPGETYAVALDAQDRPLFGDDTGLYRYEGQSWRRLGQRRGICDIVVAADGTIFAEFTGDRCGSPFDRNNEVHIVRPGDVHETTLIPDLVAAEFDRVATATQRNRLWTVARDGAVWYLETTEPARIARHDGVRVTYQDLPFAPGYFPTGPLEVDANNTLWFANDGDLWRLAPVAGFHVDPQHWLLAPGAMRGQTVSVRSVGGYSGQITLELRDLPSAITATVQPNPVAAGQATRITLNAAPTLAPGVYHGQLLASGDRYAYPVPLTLTVAHSVYDRFFPFLHVER